MSAELPATMPAVAMTDSLPATDDRSLVDIEVPVPRPGPRDLLVEIAAVAMNPVDTKIRRSAGRQEPPKILGYDAVGTVREVGAEVALFSVGDRVWYAGDRNRPGSNAAYQLVDERIVGTAPATLSDAEAAAVPLTAITAWEALFDRLRVGTQTTGRLLVMGGAGGVSSMIIQLARRLTGLTVIGTASREESAEWVRELGADAVIDHRRPLTEQIDGPVDLVFSSHSDGRAAEFAQVLAPQGSLVLIDDPAEFDVRAFKAKSITVCWESMFTRPTFATADLVRQHEILDRVARLIDDGTLRTTLAETVDGITAANLRAAHARIEAGDAVGKLVLLR
ncbi:zinc-binding alcohol dehydrogenase family protein [Naumannella cuiyingiana]|uniref:Zinc-type alcohol dehydrogenase-like protein n=1 Tax=Naumannella cuiyingiana TaxID=1347891 RepID=A0A7Z0IM94_9ACTN|nr:zinc-binding alcohol dehydrogenase family protein [Naumannella cuiyingiana]NYI72395.1 NADPH2:quinone reductase [Naumannella cuiyingiana]